MMSNKLQTTNEILSYLIGNDSDFQILKSKFGLIEFELKSDIYKSLIFEIAGQMLSIKAKRVIVNRIENLVKSINPSEISKLSIEELKKCGLSTRKAEAILMLTEMIMTKKIVLSDLYEMDDKDAKKYLMQIKGIGKWTAEMILLFSLGRENIFSYDDVALKNGIMKLKNYKSLSEKRFDSLKKKYSPYCSYAALYYYKLNDE